MLKLGALTGQEIHSQPDSWEQAIRLCQQHAGTWKPLLDASSPMTWFVGCGTSFYLAAAAAAVHRARTGQEAAAIPASELLLFPDLYLSPRRRSRCVLISRSGSTTEIVRLAERLQRRSDVTCVALTCRADRPLAQMIPDAVVFPHAFDESVVMTCSFSTMLLGLGALSSLAAGEEQRLEGLMASGAACRRLLEQSRTPVQELAAQSYRQFIFLGQGPLFGIAQEASLKMKEMSISTSEAFHSLEERHGPKSVVDAGTLVTAFSSEVSQELETVLLQEMRELGADTLQIVPREASGAEAGGAVLALNSPLDLYDRLPLYIVPAQLLALAVARAKGIDCDQPQALSAVVEFSFPRLS